MKQIKQIIKQTKPLVINIGRWVARTPLIEVLFVVTLVMQRWWLNSDISYPVEMLIPIVLFGVLAIITYIVYLLIFRRSLAAHAASLPLIYFGMYQYQFTHDSHFGRLALKLVPPHVATPFTQSIVLLLVLGVLCGLFGYGLNKAVDRYTVLQHLQLQRVLLFAALFIFVLVGWRVIDRLGDIRTELVYRYPAPTAKPDPHKTAASKPNIYFLMYEDYADDDTLERVNNFDNSPLLNYLSGEGFVNRRPAYSNYPFTTSSLASVLAMHYFPEFEQMFGKDGSWQTTFPYRSIINNPPAAQLLKQNGYTYNQLSSWWENTRINVQADNQPTKGYRLNAFGGHFFLSDLSRDILNKSVLSPFLKKGLTAGHTPVLTYDRDYDPPENLSRQITALKQIAASSPHTSPQFTFGHFMIPHTPYIYKPDGSIASYSGEHDDDGAPENVKYANQVAYLNSQIENMVGYIRRHDPNAVILIQSDEGSYPPEFRGVQTPKHYFTPVNLPPDRVRQKFSILASYYLPGATSDEVHGGIASAVNVFPYVLNRYLGYSIPLLPDCQLATGNKFRLYNYTDLTPVVQPQTAASQCSRYQ